MLLIALDEPSNRAHGNAIRTAGYTAAPVTGAAIRRIAPILGMRPSGGVTPEAPLYTLAGNE